MSRSGFIAALVLCAALPQAALAQGGGGQGAAVPGGRPFSFPGGGPPKPYVSYMPPSGGFVCDVPNGWSALEESSPHGMSTHFFGPRRGLIRPAFHVHLLVKEALGFLPFSEALKRARSSSSAAKREVTSQQAWRVCDRPSRMFEARERRLIPPDALPAESAMLHHFYAFVPAGEDYFIVKLTVDEDEFQDYRSEFRRFLKSFQILGHR
ncbi:MAG: hypothetical protein HY922_16110 [Elusimicrobia bacterium]|nr:hypothetical protein [Elusimicrobiota bacterium]